MLKEARARDRFGVRKPEETIPPEGEHFTFHAVWAVELYTPLQAQALLDRLQFDGDVVAYSRNKPGGAMSSGFHEAAADRVAGEFDAVAHPELVENVGAVPLDCLDGDDEHVCDFFRRVCFGDQLEDLELAWR